VRRVSGAARGVFRDALWLWALGRAVASHLSGLTWEVEAKQPSFPGPGPAYRMVRSCSVSVEYTQGLLCAAWFLTAGMQTHIQLHLCTFHLSG